MPREVETGKLSPEKIVIYRVNSKDEIIWLNEEWSDFAKENMAANYSPSYFLGKSIISFIAGRETKHLYQVIMDRVRKSKLNAAFPFRCDSPTIRRFMNMLITPHENFELEFRSQILKIEFRDPVNLLDSTISRSDSLIRMCSWCKKVFVHDSDWVEVEEAVKILRLFEDQPIPQITHGACERCENIFLNSMEGGI